MILIILSMVSLAFSLPADLYSAELPDTSANNMVRFLPRVNSIDFYTRLNSYNSQIIDMLHRI
jgi:hypothetical protein